MRAQALLRRPIPSGELAQILDLVLDALLATLARDKLGATTRPRTGQGRSAATDPRHVPSEVKRAVHARDGEQCSFVNEAGERCLERGFLELDHPYAGDGVRRAARVARPRIHGWRSVYRPRPERTPAGDLARAAPPRRARRAAPSPRPSLLGSEGAVMWHPGPTPGHHADGPGLSQIGSRAQGCLVVVVGRDRPRELTLLGTLSENRTSRALRPGFGTDPKIPGSVVGLWAV